PSQQRGPDIAVYVLPEDTSMCYEFSFKRKNRDATCIYICTHCRALKDKDSERYGPVPSVKVKQGRFIENPCLNHYCEPKSTARACMRREIIKLCNTARTDSRVTVATARNDLINAVNKDEYATSGSDQTSDSNTDSQAYLFDEVKTNSDPSDFSEDEYLSLALTHFCLKISE
ncbi:hypothetical protein Y032_1536g3912, partial [Ancylostoma ceylanicum]